MSDTLHLIILILHVLGATILVGTAFISLIIQFKFNRTNEQINILGFIWKVTGPILLIQILTGLYLAFSEWENFGSNPLFWIKMFLIFIVGLTVGIVSNREFKMMKSNNIKDLKSLRIAFIGFLTFATIASIGVILAETAM